MSDLITIGQVENTYRNALEKLGQAVLLFENTNENDPKYESACSFLEQAEREVEQAQNEVYQMKKITNHRTEQ